MKCYCNPQGATLHTYGSQIEDGEKFYRNLSRSGEKSLGSRFQFFSCSVVPLGMEQHCTFTGAWATLSKVVTVFTNYNTQRRMKKM
jgi:hypothetical protein